MEEYICDKCNGTGKIFDTLDKSGSVPWTTCPKCDGEKKLNWLEMIFGKQNRHWTVNWNLHSKFSSKLESEVIEKLGKEISLSIDKEVMNNILKDFKEQK